MFCYRRGADVRQRSADCGRNSTSSCKRSHLMTVIMWIISYFPVLAASRVKTNRVLNKIDVSVTIVVSIKVYFLIHRFTHPDYFDCRVIVLLLEVITFLGTSNVFFVLYECTCCYCDKGWQVVNYVAIACITAIHSHLIIFLSTTFIFLFHVFPPRNLWLLFSFLY